MIGFKLAVSVKTERLLTSRKTLANRRELARKGKAIGIEAHRMKQERRRRPTGKQYFRRVIARGKEYWYIKEKKKEDGKVKEITIRRLIDKEIELVKEARRIKGEIDKLGEIEGGIPGLRLHPLGYTCEDRGGGFYRVKPKLKEGNVFVTKGSVTCREVECKRLKGKCDHVRLVERELRRRGILTRRPRRKSP